jgi:hypothetical protein
MTLIRYAENFSLFVITQKVGGLEAFSTVTVSSMLPCMFFVIGLTAVETISYVWNLKLLR